MINKKAQVMDWCMTYGCAVLVVIVAIVVLAYFGVFSPYVPTCHCFDNNLTLIESATIDGIKHLECSETKNIIQNNSITKVTYIHLFICDESERVLIPYEYYLKILESEE